MQVALEVTCNYSVELARLPRCKGLEKVKRLKSEPVIRVGSMRPASIGRCHFSFYQIGPRESGELQTKKQFQGKDLAGSLRYQGASINNFLLRPSGQCYTYRGDVVRPSFESDRVYLRDCRGAYCAQVILDVTAVLRASLNLLQIPDSGLHFPLQRLFHGRSGRSARSRTDLK